MMRVLLVCGFVIVCCLMPVIYAIGLSVLDKLRPLVRSSHSAALDRETVRRRETEATICD